MQFQGVSCPFDLKIQSLKSTYERSNKNPIILKQAIFNSALGIQHLELHLYLCFAAVQHFPTRSQELPSLFNAMLP